MKPDGSCLTWLTNGAPASANPAWRPGEGSSDPGACGAVSRPPIVETDMSFAKSFHKHRLYWLGLVSKGGLLLSQTPDNGEGFFDFDYSDCAYYSPSQCPKEVDVQIEQICLAHPFFAYGPRPRIFHRRGALVHIPANREQAFEVYTGDVEISIYAAGGRRELEDVIAQLKPYGKGKAGGRLPQARLPDRLWHSLQRTKAAVGQLGGTKLAAYRLGVSTRTVRQRLVLLRKLRSVGHVGVERCHGVRPHPG
jgi:hypothetical protein